MYLLFQVLMNSYGLYTNFDTVNIYVDMSNKSTTNGGQFKPNALSDQVYKNMATICHDRGPTVEDSDGHKWRFCSTGSAYTNGLHFDAQGAWRVDNPALAETMIRTVSDVYRAIGVYENATQYYIPEYIWIGTGYRAENWIQGWVRNKKTNSTLRYNCQSVQDVVRESARGRLAEFSEHLENGNLYLEARCGS